MSTNCNQVLAAERAPMADTCCCIDVDEPAEVHCSVRRRARKAWKCCECGRTIPPGAYYWSDSLCYDGSWSRYQTCELCHAVAGDRFECGYILTELWQDLYDCLWEPCDCEDDCDCDAWLEPPTHPILPGKKL